KVEFTDLNENILGHPRGFRDGSVSKLLDHFRIVESRSFLSIGTNFGMCMSASAKLSSKCGSLYDMPLLVVMAFASPFGFGIVLLGKEEELEVDGLL
nr:hypothetical protein [Tanacetum cinerariifolium]